jgi:hypothetical protein
MALFRRARAGASRISRSSWETRLAVGAPILIAALSLPILLGAFSAAQESDDVGAFNGYTPPTTVTPTTLAPGAPCPSSSASTTSTGTATPDTVDPGGSITVNGGGFTPGASVTVTLCSDPVQVGIAAADGSGNVVFVVVIPSDTSVGSHTIAITGPGPSGTHAAVAAFTVTGSETPATTTTTTGTASDVAANPSLTG